MQKEQAEQILLMNWIRLYSDIEPFCFHIANERKCSARQGYLLKRMGVKSGVSDLFIAIPKNNYHGLFLELKVGKNKPTVSQLLFRDNMIFQGYKSVISYGFDEAKNSISEYCFL